MLYFKKVPQCYLCKFNNLMNKKNLFTALPLAMMLSLAPVETGCDSVRDQQEKFVDRNYSKIHAKIVEQINLVIQDLQAKQANNNETDSAYKEEFFSTSNNIKSVLTGSFEIYEGNSYQLLISKNKNNIIVKAELEGKPVFFLLKFERNNSGAINRESLQFVPIIPKINLPDGGELSNIQLPSVVQIASGEALQTKSFLDIYQERAMIALVEKLFKNIAEYKDFIADERQTEISVERMRKLNDKLIRATVQVYLYGTFYDKETRSKATGEGLCTGFVKDPHTIGLIRHCAGIDPKKTFVTKILEFEPNENQSGFKQKKALTSPNLGKSSFVFPDKEMGNADYQTTINEFIPYANWDFPAAIVFKKSLFQDIEPLEFSDKPFSAIKRYCLGHFVGYKSEKQWKIQQGITESFSPTQNFYFLAESGSWKSTKITSVNFNFKSLQPGNSGSPIVNCKSGKIVSIAQSINRKTPNIAGGLLLNEELKNKLQSAITKAENAH